MENWLTLVMSLVNFINEIDNDSKPGIGRITRQNKDQSLEKQNENIDNKTSPIFWFNNLPAIHFGFWSFRQTRQKLN